MEAEITKNIVKLDVIEQKLEWIMIYNWIQYNKIKMIINDHNFMKYKEMTSSEYIRGKKSKIKS